MRVLVLFFLFSSFLFSPNTYADNSLTDYLNTAILFKESGEYQRAIDVLKSAEDLSNNPKILECRAKLEFLSGHSNQALNFFNSIESKNWQNFVYLGLIYEDLGKDILAIESYLKSLNLRENSIAYFRLGKIYRNKKNYQEAIKYFSKIIKFDPSIRLAYYYLGECFYQSNDYRQAYKFLAKAINFYPGVDLISEKLKAVKEKIGEDFFESMVETKEAKRKKVELTSYLQEKDIPLVRVGLVVGENEFSFFCPNNFLISNDKDSYSGLANKFYTFVSEKGKIILRDYQSKTEYKTFSEIVSIIPLDLSQEKSPFYILNISSGGNNFWYKERDKAYRGELEIIVGDNGLTLINLLSVEEYLYGVFPKWIPMTYSNRGLLPWQGAALWVFGEKIPLIQLRKGFKKGRFLFYSRDEVLNHEILHALRVAFNEPRFEEILAYEHSASRWRQFLGPLFRKPSHALFFISLILISLVVQTTSLFFLSSPFLPIIRIVTVIPFIDLVFRFAALIKDRRMLKKALKKLSQIFPNQKNTFPIVLRLKDSEIQKFASQPVEKILEYLEDEVSKSPRIRQILAQFC